MRSASPTICTLLATALVPVGALAERGGPLPPAVEAEQAIVRIHAGPGHQHPKVGVLHRGAVVEVEGQAEGRGCRRGWIKISGGGYVCRSAMGTAAPPARPSPDLPQAVRPLARYLRVAWGPTLICRNGVALSRELEDQCREAPVGAWLRLGELVQGRYRPWAWRTVAGEWVRHGPVREATPVLDEPGAEIETLREGDAIARRETDVRLAPSHEAKAFRRIPRHGRLRALGSAGDYVRLAEGGYVQRRDIRLFRPRPPPEGLPPSGRWIAVDRREQTLVAYEGEAPVYSTLVSTGRPGHSTPRGTFPIGMKSLATDMADSEPGDPYLIEDVPWVMTIGGGRALHAAFWHDRLGDRRSHGCINLALADAEWLFRWSDPQIPEGWHMVVAGPGRPSSLVVVF